MVGVFLLPVGLPTARADIIVKKRVKTKKVKKPKPPRLPWSKDRVCKRHRDCALLPPYPCSCPPCGDVWRVPVNQRTLRAFERRWSVRRCKRPKCKKCKGRYLGTRAVCVKKQCAVR